MKIYKLTASQLVSLLRILGALIADYVNDGKKPMAESLRKFVSTPLEWKELPSLASAINTALKGGDKLSALYELGNELKASIPDFNKNEEYTSAELQLLRAIRSYLSTDSETALTYIRKNASLFNDHDLAAAFAPPPVKSDHSNLRRIVKTLVGRDGTHLTVPESQMIKETDPKRYDEYSTLRKAHNLDFKTSLMNYVRGLKQGRVSYEDAYKQMVAQGFTHSMVPGFKGLIDDQGRWYTTEGDLIFGVPNLTTYSHVVMNPEPSEEAPWIYKAFKEDGTAAYAYTVKFKQGQSQSKFEHVKDLTSIMTKVRSNWLHEVKNFDINRKESVAAIVLELLFIFAARIGSAPGRGVGTLIVKQASVTTQGINLAYLGKDSIPTKHILKTSDPYQAHVILALRQLLADKKGNDYIFTYNSGTRKLRVSPSDVNKAFHEFGAPSSVSVHKIRTYKGTTLFQQEMDLDAQKRPPQSEKEALARYKEMCAKVGKLLNHKRGVGTDKETVTGVTAATSYIDSSLQIDLFHRWGFRPPKNLENLTRSGDE
jgi:hypothetical protein